jgi:hypothetical protein
MLGNGWTRATSPYNPFVVEKLGFLFGLGLVLGLAEQCAKYSGSGSGLRLGEPEPQYFNFKRNFKLKAVVIKAVEWIRNFEIIYNSLNQTIEKVKAELGRNLVLDVKTRWNSLADMINMFLKILKFIKNKLYWN